MRINKTKEFWAIIPNTKGRYAISSFGAVRKMDYVLKSGDIRLGSILKPYTIGNGYKRVCILGRTQYIHRLVAEAFIKNKEQKPHINHIDFNPSNNRYDNLEWCTPSENARHSAKAGRFRESNRLNGTKGRINGACKRKLTPADVRFIRSSKLTLDELSLKFSVGKTNIFNAKHGITYAEII